LPFTVRPSVSRSNIAEHGNVSRVRRFFYWQVTLLPAYAIICVILAVAVVVEVTKRGPYTSWYNQRLNEKALRAGLVGAPESRVEEVLGRADGFMRSWVEADGRIQALETYQYYPYPRLPLSQFEVHCAAGVVRSLEMFGDRGD
jgi:hypothetical protein